MAFGQLAENAVESLVKGTAVLVTGRAAQEEWETKDGQKRRSIKVTADEVAPSLRFRHGQGRQSLALPAGRQHRLERPARRA